MSLRPLQEQGSARRFFRVETPPGSKVIMDSADDNSDFGRWVRIGNMLHSKGLGAPEIFQADETTHVALMEDLGDKTLHRLVESGNDAPHLYRKAVDFLVSFQEATHGDGDVERLRESGDIRDFDYDYLRWESSYFRDNLLKGVFGLKDDMLDGLDKEFHDLANAVLAQPQTLIHRDFQSQNIIFKEDEPRIVDFQGARIGALCFDIASLLKDPYTEPATDLRREMIGLYFDKVAASRRLSKLLTGRSRDELFLLPSLQRNMQALGAYGFLSIHKGKRRYLKFIPRGLELLKEGLADFAGLRSAPFKLDKLRAIADKLEMK